MSNFDNLDNDDVKSPFNLAKYNLFTFKIDKLDKDKEFDLGLEIESSINKIYDKQDKLDSTLLKPHIFERYENEKLVIYVLGDNFFENSLKKSFDTLNISYDFSDETDELLNLNFKLENNKDNDEYDNFIEKMNDFKLSFITVDKVLDKISRSGMESLEKDEKEFLIKS